MGITAALNKRSERKLLNSMNPLSLLRRSRHKKTASKPNRFAASNSDRLLKTKNESSGKEKVVTPVNDSAASCSTSDERSHVLPHAHQSTCSGVSSKAVIKCRLQGLNNIDLSQDFMEQNILALRLFISINTVLLILTSELSRRWRRFLEIAFRTSLLIKKGLAEILLVILDLAFGLFVVMLYSRELSMKPLILAFDELKLLSTYFVASRPLRSYSNDLRGMLGFFKNSRGF